MAKLEGSRISRSGLTSANRLYLEYWTGVRDLSRRTAQRRGNQFRQTFGTAKLRSGLWYWSIHSLGI